MNKIGGQVTSRALSGNITQVMLDVKSIDIQIFDLRAVNMLLLIFVLVLEIQTFILIQFLKN